MKFVLLFGPPAVGKMTVGQHLSELTGMPLFHNHMTIELVHPFFDFGTKPFNRLNTLFRSELLREVAESDLPGVIFTFVWALDLPKEAAYVDQLMAPFVARGADIYYVELEADLDTRLARNRHPHRLAHKPTKRNLAQAEASLRREHAKYRENSNGDFPRSPHLKLNNTDLSPEAAARQIADFLKTPTA